MNEKDKPAPPAPPAVKPATETLSADIARLTSDAGATLPASPAAAATPAAPSAIELETTNDVRGILVLLGMVVAPNWNLQPAEFDALSQGTAKVLLKYWPDGIGAMGPEGALAVTALAIAAPRMMQGIPLRAEPPKPEADSVNGNQDAKAA